MKSVIVLGFVGLLGLAAGSASAEVPRIAPVFRVVDAATGATVSVFRPAPDRAVVEVVSGEVTIVKSLAPGVAETRVISRREDLTVRLSRAGVSVRDARLGLTADGIDQAGLTRARTRLQASRAVREAIGLLEHLELGEDSPVGYTLRATRALLESAVTITRTASGMATSRTGSLSAPRLADSGLRGGDQEAAEGDSPTDCWEAYTKEAIEAWIEYEQCVDSEEWYDALGLVSCLTIYEMRAIGAFSWWVSCVGFRS
jgi:hypothetical protein